MGRPNSGEVTERPWKDGNTITFGARLYAYGRRHRLVFGTNLQGWNLTRAEIELESILQQVERGTWAPPEKKTSVKPAHDARPDGHQLFGAFARSFVEDKKHRGLDEDTVEDLEWRLGYLVGELGPLELLEIDVARVDALRNDLARRSEVIRKAAKRGKPLMETVRRKDGKSYERRKRPLANSSINKILMLLSQIMQRALDYGYVERNPVKIGERAERFMPAERTTKSFLEVDEFLALLDAAGELDGAKRLDQRSGRRGALVALGLAGFRISELCDLRCSQVDLARARFKLTDAKTAKGVREVEMTLWTRDELLNHKQQRLQDGFPMGPTNHFFGTSRGTRRDPDRFRDRVLERSVTLANEKRSEQGLPTLPRITPHSLRRTWAMFAAQAGRDPHWISDQIGHASAAFTLEVYQQTRNRRPTAKERQMIWELMRFADEPAECPLVRGRTDDETQEFRPINRPTAKSDVSASTDKPAAPA
jgi:integrase